MYKRLAAIVLISAVMTLSLTACGKDDNVEQTGKASGDNSSTSTNNKLNTSTVSADEQKYKNAPSITIQQEGDNVDVIVEGDVVKAYCEFAKDDEDNQFILQFSEKLKKAGPKKGFLLSFSYEPNNEIIAFYHNIATKENYFTFDEGNRVSFSVSENKAIWKLNRITLPFNEVEIASVFAGIQEDNNSEHYEMPISGVKIESNVNADKKDESNNSSAVGEKITANYIGTYLPEDEQGYQCVVVVEENRLTIDDRYVVEFTVENFSTKILWNGLMTDTKTGKTCDAFLTLYPDGKMLLLHTYIDSKDIFIQSIKH